MSEEWHPNGGSPSQEAGRVVLRMSAGNNVRDVTWNMRIDTFFSSGLAVLEQLIALRGRLRALSGMRGTLNDLLLEHVMQVSFQEVKDQGSPPITEEDWKNLKEISISKYHMQDESNASCCICKDEFALNQKAVQLPCGHVYCKDCIKEWLDSHRTCPMCREEVVGVGPQKWRLDECGFEQLRGQECFLSTAGPGSLIILSKCSHSFHRACLRRHLRLRMRDNSETFKLDCPLCHTPNTLARADLCSGGVLVPLPTPATPCTIKSSVGLKKSHRPLPPSPTPGGSLGGTLSDGLKEPRKELKRRDRDAVTTTGTAAAQGLAGPYAASSRSHGRRSSASSSTARGPQT
eukprot:TRINITY_DN24680_c0_g1_i1.p1 TRINITY_DN24680_c0_g1~~TRINITY_DN24680_c0_g1_i1.p1  ORF type:complete len:347 (+),score=57.76 TRINITY_DN24680_c0_g1_i1:36-1076(+)